MDLSPVNLVVCKICERQVNARQLGAHSLKCKAAAELRQKVLQQQSKLSVLANRAYELRNQLNTNFALQKVKHTQKKSQEPENPLRASRISSSPAEQKKPVLKYFKFLDEKSEYEQEHEFNKKLNPKDPRLGFRRYSELKLHEYEQEFSRAVYALKVIIQYGSRIHTNEVDFDISNDFKLRNEISFLYVTIKDKEVSAYLQKFINHLQKFIKHKKKYMKRQEELERADFSFSIRGSQDSLSVSSEKLLDPNLHSFKSFRMISLDDSDVSEISVERKSKIPDSRWLRRGSAGNPLPPKGSITLTVGTERDKKRGNTTLSRFASPLLQKKSRGPSDSELDEHQSEPQSETGATKRKIPRDLHMDLNRISGIFFRFENRRIRTFDHKRSHDVKMENEEELVGSKPVLKRLNTTHIDYLTRIAELKDKLKMMVNSKQDDSDSQDSSDIWKKRKSWNHVRKDIDIKILFTQPEAPKEEEEDAGTCQEEGTAVPLSKSQVGSSSESSEVNSDVSSEESKEDQESRNENDDYDGVFENLAKVTMKGYYSDSEVNEAKKTCPSKTSEVSIEDFQLLKFIGEGAYGKIYLARKKATGDIYAMKIVNFEDRDATHNKMSSLRAESKAYKSIKGDWVVKAYYTFSYKHYVCFVLEYMIGGDLEGLLEQVGCFEEPVARFYFAELVLAVESLHSLGIVHRDLKPDNVLIDANGHIKLTDFGLSENGVVKMKEYATTLQSLTRIPSVDQNANAMRASLVKDIINQLHENISIGRTTSAEMNALQELEVIQSPVKVISSTFSSECSGIEQESYIVKNKEDERAVFTFLNGEESNHSWMGKTKLRKSCTSGSNGRKKELHRIVGTPDYMAPEIIKGDDCSHKSIDLWSLGVILYEFLVGVPPFNDNAVDKIFDNIIHQRYEWPNIGRGDDCITPEAADLISRLLEPNIKKRLTLPEVKAHEFFKGFFVNYEDFNNEIGFDWSKVKELQAPVIPKKKEFDTQIPLALQNIFMEKTNGEQKSSANRRGISFEEVTNFHMKRIDLLHQLNQTVYNTHMNRLSHENSESHPDKSQ